MRNFTFGQARSSGDAVLSQHAMRGKERRLYIYTKCIEVSKMAQYVKAPVIKADDPSLVPKRQQIPKTVL